jgi:hypothetical protein
MCIEDESDRSGTFTAKLRVESKSFCMQIKLEIQIPQLSSQ